MRTSWPVRREKENCRRAVRSTGIGVDFARHDAVAVGGELRALRRALQQIGPARLADRFVVGLRVRRDADLRRVVIRRQVGDQLAGFQIESLGEELHPIALRLVVRFEAAGENQVVGRARAGDVQQPLALFEFFARSSAANSSCRWRPFRRLRHRGLRHERAELGISAARRRAECRRAIQIGHDHQRKLEALGVVDRHQANHVGRFGQRGGERFLRLLGDELGELRDEAVEVDDAAWSAARARSMSLCRLASLRSPRNSASSTAS